MGVVGISVVGVEQLVILIVVPVFHLTGLNDCGRLPVEYTTRP
jgi:hypothetical protein